MASANDQIYRQLKPTESRLVLLAPGNHNDPIICSLKYFDVLHPPPYEALSYVWGDPKITAPISIDGHNLQVTTNLEIALRHLRLEQATRILWIDAININQLDMNERAQQVAMMANIYRNADLVVVWLGPADEYTEMFFKLAKEKRGWRTLYSIKVAWSARAILLDLEKEDIQQRSICGSRRLHQARKIFVIHDFFWSLRHGALYFGQGLATLHLIQNEWFSRRWCIQEHMMARRVMVQCGAHKAHWIFMQQLLLDGRIWGEGVQRWMGDETDKLRFKVTTVTEKLWHRNKTVTEKTRNTLSLPQGRSTLPELLYFFRTWLNGDPRDTVYSLLALVESQELGIIVDYTRSDVDVLVDVVDCTLRHDNDLNLIGLPWAPNIVGLPSWIVPTDSHSRYRDEFDFITSAIHVSPPTNINLPTSPWRTNASIVRRREISPVPFVFPNYTLFVDGLTLGTYDETAKLPDNDLSFYEYKRLLPYSVRQFYLWTTATLDRPEAHSATSKPGDRLVVLFGCNHILTLRPVESHFVLVESWLGNFWDFLTSDQHRLHADAMAYRNKIKNFLKDLPTETFAIA